MRKYDYVLFDLDGTLTDPGEGITNSVMYALEKFGIKVDDRKKLYPFIGPPLHEAFETFFGFSHTDAARAVDYYREYYRERGVYENKLYDGIPELLASLKEGGLKILLATSKPEYFAGVVLRHFKIDSYFDFVGGSNLDGSRTKKAEVIEYTLASASVADRRRAIMVGDREHDINGARLTGLHVAAVTYGYGSREELAEADYIIDNLTELKKILLSD